MFPIKVMFLGQPKLHDTSVYQTVLTPITIVPVTAKVAVLGNTGLGVSSDSYNEQTCIEHVR